MTRHVPGGRLAGAVGVVIALAMLTPAGIGLAATGQPRSIAPQVKLPQPQPATGTPHFPATTAATEQVRQLVQCGNTMYAVGTFSVVEQAGQTFTRNNAFSFKATAPFTITSWRPNVNGTVNSIAFNSGHCGDAYIGGNFTKVNGRSASRIAKLSTAGAGGFESSFRHNANKQVETIASYQNHLLVGGFFTTINGSNKVPYMISLSPRNGVNDGFLNLHISGHVTFPHVVGNPSRVYNQQISHSFRFDLVEGDFTSVGGKHRQQVFMLNLASRPHPTVTTWTSPRFDGSKGYPPKGYYYNCGTTEPFYVRAGAWSPDDKTIYLASTGQRPWNAKTLPLKGLCDSASAFSATGARPAIKWTNYTGCDSLFAVAADASAAYFAGHERWSQNTNGCDKQGPGGIVAPGMEALHPSTGQLFFNSSHTSGLYSRGRGLGADDMLITKAGLWIASDNFGATSMCNGVQDLAGICFLPYPH
ncbi:MAG TPA: hypothetical protein VJT16_08400 [Streptosporangiaceae bacterium]|nr:hypothetical protein [Streptosporangiaceae bacterium]